MVIIPQITSEFILLFKIEEYMKLPNNKKRIDDFSIIFRITELQMPITSIVMISLTFIPIPLPIAILAE